MWKNRGSTQLLHIIDDCSDYLSHFLCCLACRSQRMPSTTLPSLLRTVAQASGIIDGWEYHETICQNKWDRHWGKEWFQGRRATKKQIADDSRSALLFWYVHHCSSRNCFLCDISTMHDWSQGKPTSSTSASRTIWPSFSISLRKALRLNHLRQDLVCLSSHWPSFAVNVV